MILKEIAPNIFNINFETQEKLASTFLRFQEHFESPKFKGKIFTLEEYKKWYIQNSPKGKETEKFTYYFDWNGFNIPSSVLEPFYKGDFDPLSEKEEAFLDLFRDKKQGEIFYIIGTHGESDYGKEALKHEIAHGLFFTNPKYKEEVLRILGEIPLGVRTEINGFLEKSGGYHPDVWEDETHAYIIFGLKKLQKRGVDISMLLTLEERLGLVFDSHCQ